MFAEQALGEFPTLSKLPISLEKGMHPGDWGPGAVVLYPVAGDGVVFHDLAGPAAALDVNLVEDYVATLRDAQAVFTGSAVYRAGVKDRQKKRQDVARWFSPDRLHNGVHRDGADVGAVLKHRFKSTGLRLLADSAIAFPERGVVARRILDISAGGFVVAAAVLGADDFVVGVHVLGSTQR